MIFTVAIPTYNNVNTIEKTLQSCLNQTYSDEFEVLVVNNHSTDGTGTILDKYSDRIRVIENEKTVSIYENHNICLQKARGDYILYCHADDELLDDSLEKIYSILQKRGFPQRYVLWGRSMFRDFFPTWEKSGLPLDTLLSGMHSFSVFLTGGLTPSGTCYSRKSLSESAGFFVVNHPLAPSDTITYWKLIFNNFEFEMSSRLLFKRMHASTATGSGRSFDNRVEALIDAINVFKLNNNEYIEEIKQMVRKEAVNDLIFNIALYMVGLVNKKKLIKISLIIIINKPFKKNSYYKFYKTFLWMYK